MEIKIDFVTEFEISALEDNGRMREIVITTDQYEVFDVETIKIYGDNIQFILPDDLKLKPIKLTDAEVYEHILTKANTIYMEAEGDISETEAITVVLEDYAKAWLTRNEAKHADKQDAERAHS